MLSSRLCHKCAEYLQCRKGSMEGFDGQDYVCDMLADS